MLHPMRDVLSAMEDDGAWDCQVYRPNLALLLLVFLYGKGYYDDLSREERIYRIRQCITRDGENQKRLSKIAFSDESDRVLRSRNGFNRYSYMASTARMLFDNPPTTPSRPQRRVFRRFVGRQYDCDPPATAMGGFPVEAYYRIQGSRKCYIVAVCMWLTVKLQRDYSDRKQLPIDVGYIGRRHVIHTREGLERRVIENKGDNAFDLCKKIIGDSANNFERVNCDFRRQHNDKSYQDKQRTRLDEFLDEDALGLVSHFRLRKFP
jgi:hypothetical protein